MLPRLLMRGVSRSVVLKIKYHISAGLVHAVKFYCCGLFILLNASDMLMCTAIQ